MEFDSRPGIGLLELLQRAKKRVWPKRFGAGCHRMDISKAREMAPLCKSMIPSYSKQHVEQPAFRATLDICTVQRD